MGVNILAPYRIGYYLCFGAGKKHPGNGSSVARKSHKSTADPTADPCGIDGLIYFKPDGKITEKAIVSVKGGENVGVPMIRDLGHVVDRENAKIGIFIYFGRGDEADASRSGQIWIL